MVNNSNNKIKAISKRMISIIKKSKRTSIVIGGLIILILAIAITNAIAPEFQDYNIVVPNEIRNVISEEIFKRNGIIEKEGIYVVSDSDARKDVECYGNGFVILGGKKNKKETTIYYTYSYSGYGFVNDKFIAKTGVSVIPTTITLDNDNHVIDYKEAEDGANFTESIQEMYPKLIQRRYEGVLSEPTTYEDLNNQSKIYAQVYLSKIGRETEIGTYSSYSFNVLSDYNVSTEVCNALGERHSDYDIYVGTFETIEGGERYKYYQLWEDDSETTYSGNGIVTYKKERMSDQKIIEEFRYRVKGDSYAQILKPVKGKSEKPR